MALDRLAGREADGRRRGCLGLLLREDVIEEDVGRGRVELEDGGRVRHSGADDRSLRDRDRVRVEDRVRRGRGAVEREVDRRVRVSAGEHEVERLGLVAVRLAERDGRREVAEALGHVGGAGRRLLHVDERTVAGDKLRSVLDGNGAVGIALDLGLSLEINALPGDDRAGRVCKLDQVARRREAECGVSLIGLVFGRIDVDLVEPDDSVSASRYNARTHNLRLHRLLEAVRQVPTRNVDVLRRGVVEFDPVHFGNALLGDNAALGRIGVGRHDLVD